MLVGAKSMHLTCFFSSSSATEHKFRLGHDGRFFLMLDADTELVKRRKWQQVRRKAMHAENPAKRRAGVDPVMHLSLL